MQEGEIVYQNVKGADASYFQYQLSEHAIKLDLISLPMIQHDQQHCSLSSSF